MSRIILPKTHVAVDDKLIFLAGPITGAADWQSEAIKSISLLDDRIYIASPRRDVTEDYIREAIKGEKEFPRQLNWEQHYLHLASKEGAILFWLPLPIQHDCNRTYARDTRGELGEWRGRLAYDDGITVVVGGEPDFDGLDVIERNFLAVKPDMNFYSTLEETCAQAVKAARKS